MRTAQRPIRRARNRNVTGLLSAGRAVRRQEGLPPGGLTHTLAPSPPVIHRSRNLTTTVRPRLVADGTRTATRLLHVGVFTVVAPSTAGPSPRARIATNTRSRRLHRHGATRSTTAALLVSVRRLRIVVAGPTRSPRTTDAPGGPDTCSLTNPLGPETDLTTGGATLAKDAEDPENASKRLMLNIRRRSRVALTAGTVPREGGAEPHRSAASSSSRICPCHVSVRLRSRLRCPRCSRLRSRLQRCHNRPRPLQLAVTCDRSSGSSAPPT